MAQNVLGNFHPAVARWFSKALGQPTEPQLRGWPAIRSGVHTLIAAPTGSGKTLAAFLASIDELVRLGLEGALADETHVVYVSPLKALSNDIQKNLQVPLAGIREELETMGLPAPEIRVEVRTGDTPARERSAMTKRPPHIFVTTPESLYILLTSDGGRRLLQTARTVIVDEIHAIADDKRGSHLALSLERLAALVRGPLVRIGLSATQKPIDLVARFLVGAGGLRDDGSPACEIVDVGHRRNLEIAIELTQTPLSAVMSGEAWEEIYDRLSELIREHKSTLIFVNTRRLAERVTRHLSDRIGEENVTAHHGSMAREQRLQAEQRLKSGSLKALVATASLELGIDIGDVELVCQIGSSRSIATLLQRIGRSGHAVCGLPKGRVFPLSRDELTECTALLHAVRLGELDRLSIPDEPLDILAQHIVAMVAVEEWGEDELFAILRRAWPFRELSRETFDAVVKMLAEGFTTRRGRRGALIHRDAVNRRLRGRRGARLLAITSGGAIPDNADYQVVLDPAEIVIGSVNEDFAVESMAGDIFQLGNASWRVLRIEPGKVRVEDARGEPPSIPFWLGEAPARTAETSVAVSRLREEIERRLPNGAEEPVVAKEWLTNEIGLKENAARQLVDYLHSAKAAFGALPTQETIIAERFFDETGGMQLIIHAPFGSRLNRAWGLTLRKRFCQSFNFELQAAATEDAIVLSLGLSHSFPLESVFKFVNSNTAREVLIQAMLDAPMFPTRWRWNAGRALAIPRWRGGKKVPPALQRLFADDLLAAAFPDAAACFENIPSGKRDIPDHPLVNQTIADCLTEAMDIDAFEELLRSIERGEKRLLVCDLREPSPMAQEILNARPYAFLDDAPLEERRTQAVISRRWIGPQSASELGQLDAEAIARVREEIWPAPENGDELHEGIVLLGFLTADEGESNGWLEYFGELAADRRAAVLTTSSGRRLWIAAERLSHFCALFQDFAISPQINAPAELQNAELSADNALAEIIRGRLDGLGPITVTRLADELGIEEMKIEAALIRLETEGSVFRGRFTPGATAIEWCERTLLARIHRYTLQRLRCEIEPVSQADFMRFIFTWQHVDAEERMEGQESLTAILDQLEGFESAAAAWEGEILPARMKSYDPDWLDGLCLAGRFVWGRISQQKTGAGPIRTSLSTLVRRSHLGSWHSLAGVPCERVLGARAQIVRDYLSEHGASFFDEIVRGTDLLKSYVEEALAELVGSGLVSSDSFAGLRALLVPSHKRATEHNRRRRVIFDMESAGRWSLFAQIKSGDVAESLEFAARVLLRRYGVVFRRVLERERLAPSWGELLRVYRRMEARGEIRGGRFVSGFSGEQFALPEAVGLLRSIRRSSSNGKLICVSASDPLNLTGIVTPGERVPALLSNQILYRDGVPLAVQESGKIRLLSDASAAIDNAIRNALIRRPLPPKLRQYLTRMT